MYELQIGKLYFSFVHLLGGRWTWTTIRDRFSWGWDLEDDDEEDCENPCSPYSGCGECQAYWGRMEMAGFWKPGSGWTKKGMSEMMK